MDFRSDSETSFVLLDDTRKGDVSPIPTQNLTCTMRFFALNPLLMCIQVHPSHASGYSPGSNSTHAHDWSLAGTGGKIERRGRHFVDAYGRACSLRGVNMSGSSKMYATSHLPWKHFAECCPLDSPVDHDHDTFPANHHSVTFVGRPFPLEEAPQHFARLRRWGLSFSRSNSTSRFANLIFSSSFSCHMGSG